MTRLNAARLGGKSPREHNDALLASAVSALGDLNTRVVFLGGTIMPYMLNQPDARVVRWSKDVDVLFDWSKKSDVYAFEDALWDRGFQKLRNGPVTRWMFENQMLDVLPTDGTVVGFNAEWFAAGWRSASTVTTPGGLTFRMVSPASMLAMKFTAFRARGRGNYQRSSDIDDILLLCGGRAEVSADVLGQDDARLLKYVKEELSKLKSALPMNVLSAATGYRGLIPEPVLRRSLERIGKIAAA